MLKVWCEWDVGQEGLLFTSEIKARAWILNNPNIEEMAKNDDQEVSTWVEGVEADGLISYEALEVVE